MRAQAIRRQLRDEVIVTAPGGIDQYGQATAGTATTGAARVTHAHRRSRTPAGEEFTSTIQVATLLTVAVGYTITVAGTEYPVKAIQKATGLRGGATLIEAML
jgi:preprotein translocase subunit Sss1